MAPWATTQVTVGIQQIPGQEHLHPWTDVECLYGREQPPGAAVDGGTSPRGEELTRNRWKIVCESVSAFERFDDQPPFVGIDEMCSWPLASQWLRDQTRATIDCQGLSLSDAKCCHGANPPVTAFIMRSGRRSSLLRNSAQLLQSTSAFGVHPRRSHR